MSAFLLALVILLLRVVLLCIGHVRNCCPDAYHETPTSCVSQSRLKSGAVARGGAGHSVLLSWNIYNASSAIYYAVPVQGLSGQAESAAMSTHQRCHLAPQASNQSPKDSPLPLPLYLSPSLLWKDLCTRVMAAQMATLSFDEPPPSWGHTEGRFMPPSQRPTAVFWQPLLLLLMLLLLLLLLLLRLPLQSLFLLLLFSTFPFAYHLVAVVAHVRLLCCCRPFSLFCVCFCFRHWKILWIW